MLARNSVFARLAASARSLAAISSPCWRRSVAESVSSRLAISLTARASSPTSSRARDRDPGGEVAAADALGRSEQVASSPRPARARAGGSRRARRAARARRAISRSSRERRSAARSASSRDSTRSQAPSTDRTGKTRDSPSRRPARRRRASPPRRTARPTRRASRARSRSSATSRPTASRPLPIGTLAIAYSCSWSATSRALVTPRASGSSDSSPDCGDGAPVHVEKQDARGAEVLLEVGRVVREGRRILDLEVRAQLRRARDRAVALRDHGQVRVDQPVRGRRRARQPLGSRAGADRARACGPGTRAPARSRRSPSRPGSRSGACAAT